MYLLAFVFAIASGVLLGSGIDYKINSRKGEGFKSLSFAAALFILAWLIFNY